MADEPQDQPSDRDPREGREAPALRLVAGFWEKADAWALLRDARGEGHGDVWRSRRVEIGWDLQADVSVDSLPRSSAGCMVALSWPMSLLRRRANT